MDGDMTGDMKRGEIRLARTGGGVNGEDKPWRPCVIVSNNSLCATSPYVCVVWMTTKEKKDMKSHFVTDSSGRRSTVVCEQIYTVQKTDVVDDVLGVLTDDELDVLDTCLAAGLGIEWIDADEDDEHAAATIANPDQVGRLLDEVREKDEEIRHLRYTCEWLMGRMERRNGA